MKNFLKQILCLCIIAVFVFSGISANAKPLSKTPARVTGVLAKAISKTAIKISFKKVNGAKGYKIYRSTNNKKFKLIKTTKKNYFTNKKLKTNKTYYYKVKAFKVVKKKTFLSKKFSKVVSAKTLAKTQATTTTTTTTVAPKVEAKPENIAKAKAFIEKLADGSKLEDYTQMGLLWEPVNRKTNWIYYTGLVFEGLLEIDFDKYKWQIKDFYDQYINQDGSIKSYAIGELDSAMLGVALIKIANSDIVTADEKAKYTLAINYIYNQLENQTIYPQAGNLWLHSQKADGTPRPAWVKWNICLDGVYMSQLFLTRLATEIDNGNIEIFDKSGEVVKSENLWQDIFTRHTFVMENMTDKATGLLNHGYCVETGETNNAPWSRGIGWFAMSLMDAAEKMPDKDKKQILTDHFNSLMSAVCRWQDDETNLWYNVTDGKEEYFCKTSSGEIAYNIPETSGSAMFSFCLLKGFDTGLLTSQEFRTAGLRAFNSLVELKLKDEGLVDIYTSSSVTSDKNRYQVNGYTTNDGKGFGAFILAYCYVDNSMPKIKSENIAKAKNFINNLYQENADINPLSGKYSWQPTSGSNSWIYFTGLVHNGFLTLDSEKYLSKVKEFYLAHINDDGTIKKYATGTLDAVLPAVNILKLLNSNYLTPEERVKCEKAAQFVYSQLENQVAFDSAGGLLQHGQDKDGNPVAGWQKWRVCLDGVYMSQMYLIELAKATSNNTVSVVDKNQQQVTSQKLWNDIYKRLEFVMENMRDENTGLLYHGYDVDTKETNGVFWSRSIGWYAMVLLEAADLCPNETYKNTLSSYYKDLMLSIVKYQDESGLWYNVTNKNESIFLVKDGKTIYNITESSGSSMFSYCLLRGYHAGLLSQELYNAGVRAYNALVEIKLGKNGLEDVLSKSAVYTSPNMYQVFDYVTNDGKGVGPFILATKYAY